jgi:hypothetical protein
MFMPDLHLRLQNEETGEPASQPVLDDVQALALLRDSEITAAKVIPWGSNYTFAVALETGDQRDHLAIYKPQAGENPLWDFPHGTLYLREHAAYLLSRRLGWDIVPPTVVRQGPHGIGTLQIYVEPKMDRGDDYEFWGQRTLPIERMVLFDHLANNADRKLTHCLLDVNDKVWGIDHGLTFNEDPKLRTVLHQFSGMSVSVALLDDLARLHADRKAIREDLRNHLSTIELDALIVRLGRLLQMACHPELDPRFNVPYGWW